jgi:hypothetical protein
MEASGQLHVLATLSSKKEPQMHTALENKWAAELLDMLGRETSLLLPGM